MNPAAPVAARRGQITEGLAHVNGALLPVFVATGTVALLGRVTALWFTVASGGKGASGITVGGLADLTAPPVAFATKGIGVGTAATLLAHARRRCAAGTDPGVFCVYPGFPASTSEVQASAHR